MNYAPRFTTRLDVRDGIGRASLAGELDMSAVPILDGHLTRLQGTGIDEIILDLRELTFIDSSGVHVILRAKARAETNEQRLIMIGANPSARRLFELTGTDSLLDDIGAVEVLYRFTRNTRRPPDPRLVPEVVDAGMFDRSRQEAVNELSQADERGLKETRGGGSWHRPWR